MVKGFLLSLLLIKSHPTSEEKHDKQEAQKEKKHYDEDDVFAVYNTAIGDETSPMWREVNYLLLNNN